VIAASLPTDGLVIFAKRECETCAMVEPVFGELAHSKLQTVVLTQDDPSFPRLVKGLDDTALEQSFRFDVEAVPTVIRLENGKEVARTFGWNRAEWERVTGLQNLGSGLPAVRPGCGSKTREPGVWEELVARYGDSRLASRRIVIGGWDDEIEACFDRGWSDGLPVVPPTPLRVAMMLSGILIPMEILRLRGSAMSNVEACGRALHIEVGANDEVDRAARGCHTTRDV
jgi:thiol-disulfide isomerase/thioredoxin